MSSKNLHLDLSRLILDKGSANVYIPHVNRPISLEERYGPMVPLSEVARLFGAHQRAIRLDFERNDIPIYQFGSSVSAPLRLIEQVYGLSRLLLDEDERRHEAARWRSTYRADSSRKPIEEYVAEVGARTEGLAAAIRAEQTASPIQIEPK
jgi:hypothetical protein